jgi:hypothetical protein
MPPDALLESSSFSLRYAPGRAWCSNSDAVLVSPLNYLCDAAAIDRALIAMAGALRPGGLLAFDMCDLEWAEARRDAPNYGGIGADWAIITEFSVPSPDRFVRDITTFVPSADGLWRRDSEHHENVLIDTARIPALLRQHGIQARVTSSFGAETLPQGLRAITGHKSVPARPPE